MQAAKALLEEQLVQEQSLRLAAEASKETLSQELAEQQSELDMARQQVCAQLALTGTDSPVDGLSSVYSHMLSPVFSAP